MFESFATHLTTPLISISLRNNELDHTCFPSIVHFIQSTGTLQELDFVGTKCGDDAVKILSEGISISTSIVRLNLSNCKISDDGGEILVNSLMTNKVCRELNLSFNTLGLKTSLSFAVVLKSNKTLESLDLSHNSLHEQDAIVNVMKGLTANRALKHLNLSWNSLSGEPLGKSFPKAFRASTLTTLNFEYNRLASFEFNKLSNGLKKSQSIKELYISDNCFDEEDDETLLKIFYSKSPLELLSFGRWFHLSHKALKVSWQDFKLT